MGFFDILATSKVGFAGLAGRVTELSNATAQMMAAFGPVAFGWQTFNAMVTAFAGTVGTVADNLSKVVQLFAGLSAETFKVPTGKVMSAFFDGLGMMLNEFKQRSTSWSVEADKDTAALAGFVGSIMDGIGKAVQPLMNLATFKAVPTSVIDAFFDTLGTFLNAFATRSEGFKGEATDAIAKIAANIGSIAESLGKVVDPLLKVLGFKAADAATPNPGVTLMGHTFTVKAAGASGMDAFFNALSDFLTEFAARSDSFKAKATPAIAAIATGIGSIMDGLGKVIDPIAKLTDFKAPGKSTMDAFFGALDYFLQKARDMIKALPAGFGADAAAFAANISAMFTSLNTAMTTAASIKVPADLPSLFTVILGALKDLVTYLNSTGVQQWQAGLNTMVSDAQTAAAAITAAFGAIVYPGGTTAGAGGAGSTGAGSGGLGGTGAGSGGQGGRTQVIHVYLDSKLISQGVGVHTRVTRQLT